LAVIEGRAMNMDAQYAAQGEIRTTDIRVALYLLAPYYELVDVEASEEVCGLITVVFALPFHDSSTPDFRDGSR